MIGNSRRRSASRHLTLVGRRPLAARLVGVSLAMTCAVGVVAAVAAASPAAAAPRTPSSVQSVIRHDKAFVAKRLHNCASLGLMPTHCPFGATAFTSNGTGGRLYAIELRWFTMDACDRGLLYFFDGTHFVETSRNLRPHSLGGVKSVRAIGIRKFSVSYWVSKRKFTSCAMNGNAGTDVYRYRWSGTGLAKTFGTLPEPPKVIVGSPADS